MVPTSLTAKMTGCLQSATRRLGRISQVRTVAGNCSNGNSSTAKGDSSCISSSSSSNRYRRCNASLVTPIRAQKITKRNYTSSSILPNDNGQGKSGLDHHSLFQEQLLELEKEQKQFGPGGDNDENDTATRAANSTDTLSVSPTASAVDLEDQLHDWKAEQLQVFGETLADHDDGSGPSIPPQGSHQGMPPEDREDRFEFTAEDMAAWGTPNPEPEDMQKILQQVALEREKEALYAQSASLSPQQDSKSSSSSSMSNAVPNTPPSEQHHESFSHVSGDGSSVHMVDVGHKAVTPRTAHARSEVWLPPDVLEAFLPKSSADDPSSAELVGPKGPIFATAKIAGIMACKKTSDLIPLCHPLPLDQVKIEISLQEDDDSSTSSGGTVVIDCTCKVTHKTGVEMEALTGATVAALTIYDMTKAVSHNIRIKDTRLLGKTGGKRTVLDGTETTDR